MTSSPRLLIPIYAVCSKFLRIRFDMLEETKSVHKLCKFICENFYPLGNLVHNVIYFMKMITIIQLLLLIIIIDIAFFCSEILLYSPTLT